MPNTQTFINIFTRDNDKSLKDNIKTTKIEFMINYFNQERERALLRNPDMADKPEILEIHRIGCSEENYKVNLSEHFWLTQDIPLSKKISIDHLNRIEDQPNSVIVNFANKYIGGGSLGRGSA